MEVVFGLVGKPRINETLICQMTPCRHEHQASLMMLTLIDFMSYNPQFISKAEFLV